MDIYEYLKMDHQKVKTLFKQFEKSNNPVYKTEVIAMIAKELTLHAVSEQNTFYKTLEQFDISRELAEHAEKEHQDIEDKLEEIVNTKKNNAVWERKVKKLKDLVMHHVKEEEGKIFRKAKKVLTDQDSFIIKQKMHDYKGKMLEVLDNNA